MRKICAALVLALVAPLTPLSAQGKPPITPPRLINLPATDCRAGKACHGSHGQVRLIIGVQEDGKAGDIRVEIGNGVLADVATAAALQAEFVPGSYFGKPAAMDYVLTFRF
jgi:Gram-negative bacterial TonB protein C-terminal